MGLSHRDKLEIKRAEKGISEFREHLKRLDALPDDIPRMQRMGDFYIQLGYVSGLIKETVNKYFSGEHRERLMQADLLVVFPIGNHAEVMEQMEAKIAESKDLLEEAIRLLEGHIASIKGVPVGPASGATKQDQGEGVIAGDERRKGLIIWRLTYLGFGIDLEEAGHRLRDWYQRLVRREGR